MNKALIGTTAPLLCTARSTRMSYWQVEGGYAVLQITPLWADRTGSHPCIYKFTRLVLGSRCGRSAVSRIPRPSDQCVFGDMLNEVMQRAIAVCRRVFDLLTDLGSCLAFPCHVEGREVPLPMSWNPAGIEVGILMTRATPHSCQAKSILTAVDRRLVQTCRVSLARSVASRVAIETAWAGQHFAEFREIRCRASLRVRDFRKALRRGELVSAIRGGGARRAGIPDAEKQTCSCKSAE